MIYKDVKGPYDTEVQPAPRRDEACLNCGEFWGEHNNWGCPDEGPLSFSQTTQETRYETQSMRDSLGEQQAKTVTLTPDDFTGYPQPKKDLSDWKAWRSQKPDECPCGTTRSQCDYHR
jgi:predicted  nucleic acid-binding Zn-ribbon protein